VADQHAYTSLQVDITDVVASEEHVMQLQQEQAALLREILPGE
jgi:hypothetical protein